MRKKWLAMLLAAAMLLGCLAGCAGGGGQNGGQNGGQDGQNGGNGTNGDDANVSEYAYKASYGALQLPDGLQMQYVQTLCAGNDTIYFAASIVTGTQTQTDPDTGDTWETTDTETQLFRMNVDGTGCERMTGFTAASIPDGQDGWVNISSLSATSDGSLWVMENIQTSVFDLPDDFDETTQSR